MAITAKYVEDIVIQDPDTGGLVEVSIFKHEAGGMFGIDASYLDQVAEEDCLGNEMINDPFIGDLGKNRLILMYPEEEHKK